jgi:hypothetical protein
MLLQASVVFLVREWFGFSVIEIHSIYNNMIFLVFFSLLYFIHLFNILFIKIWRELNGSHQSTKDSA